MSSDLPVYYRYQLTAEEFVFAITADDESFVPRASELRKKGVARLTGREINKIVGKGPINCQNRVYTFIQEVKVEGEVIELAYLDRPIPSIFIYKCQIPHVSIDSCKLGRIEKDGKVLDATCFSIYQSRMGNFTIFNQSTTGNFSISKSTTKNFFIWNQSITEDFNIKESAAGQFSIDKSTIGHFSILNQSRGGDFSILNQSTLGNFYIDESAMGNLYINESITGNFSIWNQSILRNFSIDESTTGYFTIWDKSTTGYFTIKKSIAENFFIKESATGYFYIIQSTTRCFEILDSTVHRFFGVDLYSSILLQNATIPEIRLGNCYLPSVAVRSGCEVELYITESVINLIDLRNLALSKDSVLSFFQCDIYACLMEEFTVLGNLFFRQAKVLSAPFNWNDPIERMNGKPEEGMDSGHNQAAIALLKRRAEEYDRHIVGLTTRELDEHSGRKGLSIIAPTFRVAQSSLGKTEFVDCDLGGFRFEYNSAKITEVFMSGGTVPEAGIVIYDASQETREEPDALRREEQKVSVYNQLKKIFEGQGDIYWATHFQSKTAEHQTQVLKIRRKAEKRCFSTTLWDLRTLQLNGLSNNHGESWGQALLFILLGAVVAYLAYLWAIGRLFHFDSEVDWDLVGHYFNFLDPIHKDDFIKDARQGFWSRLIHFLGRVYVGYGIFQFIAAFRKHGKK